MQFWFFLNQPLHYAESSMLHIVGKLIWSWYYTLHYYSTQYSKILYELYTKQIWTHNTPTAEKNSIEIETLKIPTDKNWDDDMPLFWWCVASWFECIGTMESFWQRLKLLNNLSTGQRQCTYNVRIHHNLNKDASKFRHHF